MVRKIKVLHVQLTDNFGGIESLLNSIYCQIDRSKFHFDFIATARESYQKQFKNLGARIYLMPSIKNVCKYIQNFNKVLNNNYDIIHFHKNSAANILPILIAKHHPTQPKIIVHSHNTAPSMNNSLLKILHMINRKEINKLADKRIACSKLAAQWMFGSDKNIKIINNGIDTNKFTFSKKSRKLIRNKYHINNNTFVVGNVSRFSKQKNHQFLIEIFQKLVNLHPNSILMLIGDGKLEDLIRQKVNQYKLNDKVLFLGKKMNVNEYLSAMDAFIMPSLFEGLPISAIEAQAEGLNVFVSNNISSEVFLTKQIKAFSLNNSPEKIAKMILKKKKLRGNIRASQSGVIRRSKYSILRTVKDIVNIYDSILGLDNE